MKLISSYKKQTPQPTLKQTIDYKCLECCTSHYHLAYQTHIANMDANKPHHFRVFDYGMFYYTDTTNNLTPKQTKLQTNFANQSFYRHSVITEFQTHPYQLC